MGSIGGVKNQTLPISNNFGHALQTARLRSLLPQEAFNGVSSRTYISTLERNLKSPTLDKVDELSTVMRIHPLTLLALSYCEHPSPQSIGLLIEKILIDVAQLRLSD